MEAQDDPTASLPFESLFVSAQPYEFQVQIGEHEQMNVFSGQIDRMMMCDNSVHINTRQRNVQGIHLQDQSEISLYRNLSTIPNPHLYLPQLNLTPIVADSLSRTTTFGVGQYHGVPLITWMKTSGRRIWEYDANGNYKRVGKDWRKVGRWIGGALHKEHIADRYIGNLLPSTFVDDDAERVTFFRDPNKGSLGLIAGIQEDIRHLNLLIDWTVLEFPVHNPLRNSRLDDVDIYRGLYPGDVNLPTVLEDLKELSYFMCHLFLYFECSHRFGLSASYRRLRQTYHSSFKSGVVLEGVNFIPDNWDVAIKPTDVIFRYIYNFITAHKKKHGLMHFYGSCLDHYNKEAKKCNLPYLSKEDLDEALFSLQPHAASKVFSALFLCKTIPNKVKIDNLKEDGIDYEST